jgi:hypothetical protein
LEPFIVANRPTRRLSEAFMLTWCALMIIQCVLVVQLCVAAFALPRAVEPSGVHSGYWLGEIHGRQIGVFSFARWENALHAFLTICILAWPAFSKRTMSCIAILVALMFIIFCWNLSKLYVDEYAARSLYDFFHDRIHVDRTFVPYLFLVAGTPILALCRSCHGERIQWQITTRFLIYMLSLASLIFAVLRWCWV